MELVDRLRFDLGDVEEAGSFRGGCGPVVAPRAGSWTIQGSAGRVYHPLRRLSRARAASRIRACSFRAERPEYVDVPAIGVPDQARRLRSPLPRRAIPRSRDTNPWVATMWGIDILDTT